MLSRSAHTPLLIPPQLKRRNFSTSEEHRLHRAVTSVHALHLTVQSLGWWQAALTLAGHFRLLPAGHVANAYHLVLQRLPSTPIQPLDVPLASLAVRGWDRIHRSRTRLRQGMLASVQNFERHGQTRMARGCAEEWDTCECKGTVWYGRYGNAARPMLEEAWKVCSFKLNTKSLALGENHGKTAGASLSQSMMAQLSSMENTINCTAPVSDPIWSIPGACFCSRRMASFVDLSATKCANAGELCACHPQGTVWWAPRYYDVCGKESQSLEQALSVCTASIPARENAPTPCTVDEVGRSPVTGYVGACWCEPGMDVKHDPVTRIGRQPVALRP